MKSNIFSSYQKQLKTLNAQLIEKEQKIFDLLETKDNTMKKMNFVQKKLGKLLKTNDMGQICTIVVLFLILIVMIFLVIYT